MLTDGRRTDGQQTAHLLAFGSGELKTIHTNMMIETTKTIY